MLENITAPFEHMMQMLVATPTESSTPMVSFVPFSAAEQESLWWVILLFFIPIPFVWWAIWGFFIYAFLIRTPDATFVWHILMPNNPNLNHICSFICIFHFWMLVLVFSFLYKCSSSFEFLDINLWNALPVHICWLCIQYPIEFYLPNASKRRKNHYNFIFLERYRPYRGCLVTALPLT